VAACSASTSICFSRGGTVLKILALSDQHGMLDTIVPPCDLLIVAGDQCPDIIDGVPARDDPDRQLHWFMETWMAWRKKQPAKTCVVTWGNHDFCGELQKEPYIVFGYGDTVIAIDELVIVNGMRLWLSPWTKQFMDWAFMRDEQRLMDAHYKFIPEGLDILVTHDPPYGYGDMAIDWTTKQPGHFGSKALLDTIGRVKPRAVVCGHIHEAYGEYELPLEDITIKDAGTYEITKYITVYNVAVAGGRASTGTLFLPENRPPLEIEL
jgi:Icc-related predicted phosphoesterase